MAAFAQFGLMVATFVVESHHLRTAVGLLWIALSICQLRLIFGSRDE